MKIDLAAWDTDFFGIKTGKCNLTGADDWDQAAISNWDLVYISVDPGDKDTNNLLVSKGIQLFDRKTTYLYKLNSLAFSPEISSRIRPYHASQQDTVVTDIGIQSGIFSRFNADPGFTKEKFILLYTIWMRRSIGREMADEVFVCDSPDKDIMGVITLGEKNKRADIGILAVEEKFRGQQVGRELVSAAIAYGLKNGYSELQVVTQGANDQACRFYEHCGFIKEQVVNIYHYWKN
ncbi:MAG: GNAT family N-acetyltransferase [Bacteroidota bacterium]